jgi:hypothetical protein
VDANVSNAQVHTAWAHYGDPRRIVEILDMSAMVSTNTVMRVKLSDGSAVFAKISSYGSYFLFAEDHDRLHRLALLLRGTRFEGLLADSLTVADGQPFTYYDGEVWVAFYTEVEHKQRLPRILSDADIANLAREMAHLHIACGALASHIPPTSTSIKSDAIALHDTLTEPHSAARFYLDVADLNVLRSNTHTFLLNLIDLRYDDMPKIPVLIDWNLGNFTVEFNDSGAFRLFSRWDYDWFRIDTRMLDFYFLSRVSSETGDRTAFTYGSHTLLEPRFVGFLRAYHSVNPLTEREILFLKEAYRFFILNYVVRSGNHFFRDDFWRNFQRDAVSQHLPNLEAINLEPVVDMVLGA